MKLHMNMASQRRHARVLLAIGLVALVGIAYALVRRESALSNQRLVRVEQASAQASFVQRGSREQEQFSFKAQEQVQVLASQFHRPWLEMLNELRSAGQKDIVLTQIQPDSEGSQLFVGGLATSSDAFMQYILRLRASGVWQDVQPLAEEKAGSGSDKVNFRLSVLWGGDASD